MIDLNTLIPASSGWTLTDAKGINNIGQIVGQGKYEGRSHAFLLTPQQVCFFFFVPAKAATGRPRPTAEDF